MAVITDPRALALAVDERVRALPQGQDPARLFALRLRPDGFVLVPFWSGVARELPDWVCPPDGAAAIALETGGWAAPMEDDGSVRTRPSRHRHRRRVHHTVIVHGESAEVSVLHYDDEPEPVVLEGGVGPVLERLLACWARRAAA
jgi:hypothetical protein